MGLSMAFLITLELQPHNFTCDEWVSIVISGSLLESYGMLEWLILLFCGSDIQQGLNDGFEDRRKGDH